MGRKIEDIVKECIGKALREDFQDDVSLNDPLRHLRNYDKVTDGDSARLEPQEPTEPPLPPTPNPWPKPKNNDEKRDIRKRQMQHSCANTIRNLEALGQPYDLEQVAKDISKRYNYDLNQVLDFLRLVYKQQEGILAINEAQLKKIVAESVKKVLNEGRTVPEGESEYNSENWDDEYENMMAFELVDKIRNNMSEENIHSLLAGTLYDRYDKPVGRLNDLHFKYDADTNDLVGA